MDSDSFDDTGHIGETALKEGTEDIVPQPAYNSEDDTVLENNRFALDMPLRKENSNS